MAATPKAPFDAQAAVREVSFTPGRRHFPSVVALLGDDDDKLADAAERSLLRAGDAALDFLVEALAASQPPLRARLCRAVGRFGAEREDARAVALLVSRLADEDARTRRAAATALGKTRRPEVEAPLLDAFAREQSLPERRALAAALGKVGGEPALALLRVERPDDPELKRIVDESVVRLSRHAAAGTPAAEPRAIDATRVVRALPLVVRCRRGLESLVEGEVPVAWRPRAVGPGEVRAELSGPISQLFSIRIALSFGFALPPLPLAGRPLGAVVAEALGAPEAARIVAEVAGSDAIRYRIEWAGGGKHRAEVFRAAEAVSRVRPAWINDPSARDWEVVVHEAQGEVSVELRPRFDDPRFAYRIYDVPAASHPTIAAALARVADPRSDDVVWDPFVGSGTELIEVARRHPVRALHGTDLDTTALDAARANLNSARLGAQLALGDATKHAVQGVTLVVTNPPMGRRVLRGTDLGVFLDQLVDHWGAVLGRGCRVVWLSPDGSRTARRAASLGFTVGMRRKVDLGGFDAELQTLIAGPRA